MRRSLLIVLSLLVITAATASLFPEEPYDPSQDLSTASNFFQEFVIRFRQELASLSIAAVAAMGIRAALSKYSQLMDDRSLNVTSVVLFLAMFLLVYVSPVWQYFYPIIGYLLIAGFGVIVWTMFSGLRDAKAEPWDKIVGSIGCFVLAWISFLLGLWAVGIGLGAAGLLLVLLAIPAFNRAVKDSGVGRLFGKRAKPSYSRTKIPEEEGYESKEEYDDAKEDIEGLMKELKNELTSAGSSLSEALKEIRGGLS
ncbi:hypothetical protein GF352_04375 [archaeon]|nr:hypothetical protein [archaeon]